MNKTTTETATGTWASGGTRGRFSFKRWYTCDVCTLDWRSDQVTKYKGKVYGIPCGCFKDIAQLSRSK